MRAFRVRLGGFEVSTTAAWRVKVFSLLAFALAVPFARRAFAGAEAAPVANALVSHAGSGAAAPVSNAVCSCVDRDSLIYEKNANFIA